MADVTTISRHKKENGKIIGEETSRQFVGISLAYSISKEEKLSPSIGEKVIRGMTVYLNISFKLFRR